MGADQPRSVGVIKRPSSVLRGIRNETRVIAIIASWIEVRDSQLMEKTALD
jgi:hypothetical protein